MRFVFPRLRLGLVFSHRSSHVLPKPPPVFFEPLDEHGESTLRGCRAERDANPGFVGNGQMLESLGSMTAKRVIGVGPGANNMRVLRAIGRRGVRFNFVIIGRAMRREAATRIAEAETTTACFGLGGPPRVCRLFCSADGFDYRIPRAASALVDLAMTCPGLFSFATSWPGDTEYYWHHLLENLRQGGTFLGR